MAEKGEQALPVPKRKPRKREQIAARVVKEMRRIKVAKVRGEDGVQPLNVGFFQLEALRTRKVAKAKTAKRAVVKGK